MTDIGVSCQKQSQGRGVGKPMTCTASQDYDAGLCYSKCPAGSYGVGPVCWATCPAGYSVNCGAACAKTSALCGVAVATMVVATGQVALNVGVLVATAGSSAAGQASVKGAVAAAKVSAQAIGKKAVAEGAVALARNAIKQNAVKIGVALSADAIATSSRALTAAKEEGQFDWTVLDPTGIAEVVKAFNKPGCGK